MSSLQCCALFVGFACFGSLATAQDKKQPRDPVELLRERDLLPTVAKKPISWRPAQTVDDVLEVRFENPLHPCMDESSADDHLVETLKKIRRLDDERPRGFLKAIGKYRPDLKGLPFLGRTGSAIDPDLAKHLRSAQQALFDEFAHQQPDSAKRDSAAAANFLVQRHYPTLLPNPKSVLRSREQFRAIAILARQKLGGGETNDRLRLVQVLQSIPIQDVNGYLADLAAFAPEAEVREAALASLDVRRGDRGASTFLKAMGYPLSSVVQNAADALIRLQIDDKETLETLAHMLEGEDLGTIIYSDSGKETRYLREVVKINHLQNCMLCHPPSSQWFADDRSQFNAMFPNPRKKLPASFTGSGGYYGVDASKSIRFDITYLRPDFSLTLPVDDESNTGLWPKLQRFDFLVRDRELTPQELAVYEKAQRFMPRPAIQTAALRALRELTGRDAGADKDAWLKIIEDIEKERGNDTK